MSPLADPATFAAALSRSEAILYVVEGVVVLLGIIASQWYIGFIAMMVGGFAIWAGAVQHRRVTKRRRRA
ncbi:MAG: hypothetical protein WBP14_00020 [Candidatus Saccharimonas aalborgensis]